MSNNEKGSRIENVLEKAIVELGKIRGRMREKSNDEEEPHPQQYQITKKELNKIEKTIMELEKIRRRKYEHENDEEMVFALHFDRIYKRRSRISKSSSDDHNVKTPIQVDWCSTRQIKHSSTEED
jgi:hypothetical protein